MSGHRLNLGAQVEHRARPDQRVLEPEAQALHPTDLQVLLRVGSGGHDRDQRGRAQCLGSGDHTGRASDRRGRRDPLEALPLERGADDAARVRPWVALYNRRRGELVGRDLLEQLPRVVRWNHHDELIAPDDPLLQTVGVERVGIDAGDSEVAAAVSYELPHKLGVGGDQFGGEGHAHCLPAHSAPEAGAARRSWGWRRSAQASSAAS